MEVVVASHPSALLHDTGPRHPERPDRVRAVLRGAEISGLEVSELLSPRIERTELALVHDSAYIELIERFCASGGGALDMDTLVSPGSWEAALTAAGGVRATVEELAASNDSTGFVVARPPGHHATSRRAMGFCLFNNVAVTTAYLRSRGERVAVLDWDVHHGNGTQEILAEDPGALYVSLHQDRLYPMEGHVDDIERGAKGTTINIPFPPGTAGDLYRRAWGELVLPVVSQFEPSWILVSAGFDAHIDDYLASIHLDADDFGWMSFRLAGTHPANRIVYVLEGGYDLIALETSVSAVIAGAGGRAFPDDSTLQSPEGALGVYDQAAAAIARHWRV